MAERLTSEAQITLRFDDAGITVWLFADGYFDWHYNEQSHGYPEPWSYWRNTCEKGRGWVEQGAFKHLVPIIDAAFAELGVKVDG